MVQAQIRASFDARVLICHCTSSILRSVPRMQLALLLRLACCLGIIRSLCLSHHVSLYGIQRSTFYYYLTVFWWAFLEKGQPNLHFKSFDIWSFLLHYHFSLRKKNSSRIKVNLNPSCIVKPIILEEMQVTSWIEFFLNAVYFVECWFENYDRSKLITSNFSLFKWLKSPLIS